MLEWFIILYYSYCFAYGVRSIWKRSEKGFIKTITLVFLPVLGVFIAYFMNRTVMNQMEMAEVAAAKEIELDTEHLQTVYPISNSQLSGNLIPIRDALLLNNNHTRRHLLLDMLKGKSTYNIDILKKAVENEDSETSHYAATAIMEIQREMINTLNEFASKMEKKPNDYKVMEKYAKTIKEYLSSGFGDKVINQRFQLQLSELLEKLLEGQQFSRQHFIDKLNCDLELGNYEKAQVYCQKFMSVFPSDETSYLIALKVHYMFRNSKEINRVIQTLRKQTFQPSLEVLNIIHFWLQGDNRELSF